MAAIEAVLDPAVVVDVLGDAGVDQSGPDGVTKLMSGDVDRAAGLVVEADPFLPACEPAVELVVGEGLRSFRMACGIGEQPGGGRRVVGADHGLLVSDGDRRATGEGDELVGVSPSTSDIERASASVALHVKAAQRVKWSVHGSSGMRRAPQLGDA